MPRIISGIVESDGDKRSGEGFYSNRIGNGVYSVDFDQEFGQYPAVVCSPVTNIGGTEVNITACFCDCD